MRGVLESPPEQQGKNKKEMKRTKTGEEEDEAGAEEEEEVPKVRYAGIGSRHRGASCAGVARVASQGGCTVIVTCCMLCVGASRRIVPAPTTSPPVCLPACPLLACVLGCLPSAFLPVRSPARPSGDLA